MKNILQMKRELQNVLGGQSALLKSGSSPIADLGKFKEYASIVRDFYQILGLYDDPDAQIAISAHQNKTPDAWLRDTLIRDIEPVGPLKRLGVFLDSERKSQNPSQERIKFAEELFRIETREGKEYAVKPMNCPHHAQIFDRHPHSYRDMPQRYAETTMVYRDEQSGELGGLTRVLSITQDDSHVFCRHNQVKEEFFRIWDIIDTFYGTFGFKLRVRLSFHEPSDMGKYLGTQEIWENAENALREIATERKADYFEAPGEAAMYGPKLDFMAKDSLGREHQVATIQLDMNQPERFDLTCINEKGEKERIVMIHCAVMGSIERFSAVLIEHLGGNFPLWLAPEQVRIISVSDAHAAYAADVYAALKAAGIRAILDDSNESMGKKIRNVKMAHLPYFAVVGDAEMADGTVTLESRSGATEKLTCEAFVAKLREESAARSM
jgi:threonyl-tRNA synthetase